MFEFDKYQRERHAVPVEATSRCYAPAGDVTALSQLFWSEHCIECAAPDCYQSCDLYSRRRDGRCRRFTYGIFKNKGFPSVRGYGAEVSFKTWGRLKANGNVRMEPVATVVWKERLWGLALPAINAVGSFLHACTGRSRWLELGPDLDNRARKLHRRGGGICEPDAFLIEVYNPSPDPVRVQLQMRIAEDFLGGEGDRKDIPAPFTIALELASGYSRRQFDRAHFQALIDNDLPFKLTLDPEGDDAATLVFLTLDFVAFRKDRASEAPGNSIKCVVFDLDNTLWDGVLLEQDSVRVREDAVRVIKGLDDRGILLSVASKNNRDQALQKLKSVGLDTYFLHPQINWLPKSRGLSVIAKKLNIGLDTFAFIDDSAFERDEVAHSLPQVTCLDAGDLGGLLDDPRFPGSDSVDAGNRRSYYRDAIVRDEERQKYALSYDEFLAASEIKLEIREYQPRDFDRIAELAQRTNQLNFSGTKYTREQLCHSLVSDDRTAYVLVCSDKYGSYGTVGLGLVTTGDEVLRIEELMLSCRVQGKCLEQAFFAFLIKNVHSDQRPLRLWVNFRPTDRNTPALNVLARLGFKPDDVPAGHTLDLEKHSIECEFIEVVRADAPILASAQDTQLAQP